MAGGRVPGCRENTWGFELTLTCGWDLKVELSALFPSPLLSPLNHCGSFYLCRFLGSPYPPEAQCRDVGTKPQHVDLEGSGAHGSMRTV